MDENAGRATISRRVHLVVNGAVAAPLVAYMAYGILLPCKDGLYIGMCGTSKFLLGLYAVAGTLSLFLVSSLLRRFGNSRGYFSRKSRIAIMYLGSILLAVPVSVVVLLGLFYLSILLYDATT